MTDIYIVLKKWWDTGNIKCGERNETNLVQNVTGVNIISVIDHCIGVPAIGLGITGVDLLSTIVAAPAVIEIEAVSIVMGLLRVVGNQAIKKLALK